jgi:hypothetical protein
VFLKIFQLFAIEQRMYMTGQISFENLRHSGLKWLERAANQLEHRPSIETYRHPLSDLMLIGTRRM